MSDVIDFLERKGQDASLRHADSGDVEQALMSARIDAPLRSAILAGDSKQLEKFLGAPANVCCIVAAPSDGEEPAPPDSPPGILASPQGACASR